MGATLVLGDTPEPLELRLVRGDSFYQEMQLEQDGAPIPWPADTRAWLVVRTKGSSAGQQWTAEIEGSFLRFDQDQDDVDQIGQTATARLMLAYGDADPFTAWKGPVIWA